MLSLSTSLREAGWIDAQRLRQLGRFGLSTVEDLLTHFPRRYENRAQFDGFPSMESENAVCVCGVVAKVTEKWLPGRKRLLEAQLEEERAHALSPTLVCRWFNAFYVKSMILTGQRLIVYGKPKERARRICMDHPEFEIMEPEETASIHFQPITPIYRATEGLKQRALREMIHRLLREVETDPGDSRLPEGLDALSYAEALRQIHFPESREALALARRHLVLTEFFAMQLFIAARRTETASRAGLPHAGPGKRMAEFHAGLPYPLTKAQKRVIEEIRSDLARPRPMSRLLHGEVGSGKTVVAASAMLLAVEAGFQAAIMAPTQILAEQHYMNFKRWLEPLKISVGLRTGSRREETAMPLFGVGAEGEPQVLVGTHALLFEKVNFSRLGLVVIDETHKFGVMQRARLLAQPEPPDMLVMTATPIPRTIAMTLYGDLDISTLDEMPASRGKVITAVRAPKKLPEAVEFIRKQLAEGRQAYIVYPLIDESEKLEAKAAAGEFAKWRELLAPSRCELLHGRIPPEEKEAIMQRFRRGETEALVATSVIEVGIDVANANIMLIENAERFGLAQLHQLRGRVGRGKYKSYCVLLTSSASPEALEKLKILEETGDGFAVAEADLRLRGPGDLLGTAQSGLPPLKLGELPADAELMRIAREAAGELFARDSELARPENLQFRKLLQETKKLILSQVN